MKVFLSVGSTYCEKQEIFVSAFEAFLSQHGCERLTVGRGSYFASQPIVSALDLMQKADAVVVIAFTRLYVEKAIDKPGSESKVEISDRNYPTVWNQLEAAMAFGLRLPLLVILEDGVYQEAMLKDRFEYRAIVTNLDKNLFTKEEFIGIFQDWKSIAENRQKEQYIDVNTLTIGKLIKGMRLQQLWQVGAAIFGLLITVIGATYWVTKNLL